MDDKMPEDLKKLLCDHTVQDLAAVERFIGLAEMCGYRFSKADLVSQPARTHRLDIHILLDMLAAAAKGEPLDPEMCQTVESIAKEYAHKDFTAEDVQALYDCGPKPASVGDEAQREQNFSRIVEEALNYEWGDWCGDTGCFPDDFDWKGGNGTLSFTAGKWASHVAKNIFHSKAFRALFGPVKSPRPLVTPDAARAALEDLRVIDCHTEDALNELQNAQADAAQFLIEHIDTIRTLLQQAAHDKGDGGR